jgi:hypothetical protein
MSTLNLGNHVTPTVCFTKAIFNTVNIFSHFRVKLDADMLLFQVYFLSTPKSQVEQHRRTLKKTTLSNNTCYSLTWSRQGLRRLLYWVAEICASNSRSILQSVWKISDYTTYMGQLLK